MHCNYSRWGKRTSAKQQSETMSAMLRSTLKQPCIPYESAFQYEKLEKVSLIQRYVDMAEKKNYPTFTGEHVIESLLYVEDRFRAVSGQLEYNTGEYLFHNFEEAVMNRAEKKGWM